VGNAPADPDECKDTRRRLISAKKDEKDSKEGDG
jgi:hypothetical protein